MSKQQAKRLAVSFSGGRTSAYMCYHLLHVLKVREVYDQVVFTFANTGCEHPNTLEFIRQCDEHLDLGLVWLEAKITPQHGVGVSFTVVDYNTAARSGEPYEAYIAKYGIPSPAIPQCTTRLKTDVMEKYLKSVGFCRGKQLNYDTAIGIRADEMDRVSSRYKEQRLYYPLVDAGVTKQQVLDFWKSQPFDLDLPGEHYGNCVWCWKKSFRKLFTLVQEDERIFGFPKRMEEKYSQHKAGKFPRTFWRRSLTTEQLIAEAHAFPSEKLFVDPSHRVIGDPLDQGGACGESCEIGADDMPTPEDLDALNVD